MKGESIMNTESHTGKKGFSARVKASSKYFTMFALVLALGLAVYLNWRFTEIDANTTLNSNEQGEENKEQDKKYGDTLFVSSEGKNAATYFSQARLARTESRDQALDSLQKALQDTELTEAEKTELTAKLTAIAESITAESNIESLVKSKGFSDCVAYINENSIKLVVAFAEGELTSEKTSQIVEIVLSQTEIPAQNVSIVEVK